MECSGNSYKSGTWLEIKRYVSEFFKVIDCHERTIWRCLEIFGGSFGNCDSSSSVLAFYAGRSLKSQGRTSTVHRLSSTGSVDSTECNTSLFADPDIDSCFYSPTPAGCLSLDLEEFRVRMLAAHNKYRDLHSSPALSRLPELEEGAQVWADVLAAKGVLLYCEQLHGLGESLARLDLSSGPANAEQLVFHWYREIKNYSFAEPRWRRGSFHFTQMMWRTTSHIGIGIAPVPGQPRVVVVVRYFPGGNSNFPGEFERNVLPRISKGSLSSVDDVSFLRSYSRSRSLIFEDGYL